MALVLGRLFEVSVASILVRFRHERGGAAASRGTRKPNQNVSEAASIVYTMGRSETVLFFALSIKIPWVVLFVTKGIFTVQTFSRK